MEDNVVAENIKKFKEAVDEAVPVFKEITSIKADINKDINTCIKFGLDRPVKELNYTARMLHDFETADSPEESKIYKLLQNVKTIAEYLDAMGKSNIVDRLSTDLGFNIALTVSARYTLGEDNIVNRDKTSDAYTCLFNEPIPDDKCEMVGKLINLAVDTHGEIVDKTNEVKDQLFEPIADSGIKSAVLVKGAKLKIRNESKDDVPDKINSITEQALLESEALQSLLEE